MSCIAAGAVGIGLLAASAFTMTTSDEEKHHIRTVLSAELAKKYDAIVIERRNLYFQGLILGMILAYGVLLTMKQARQFYKTSAFMAVSLMTAVVYYVLIPKSDYMLNHLKTEEQNKAWLKVYTTMRQRYFLGFLFGIIAGIPLSYALC